MSAIRPDAARVDTSRPNLAASPTGRADAIPARLTADLSGLRRAKDIGVSPGDGRARMAALSLRVDELQRADLKAQKSADGLARVGTLLDELGGVIEGAKEAGAASATGAQARIDALVKTIQDAAGASDLRFSTSPTPDFPRPWTVTERSAEVESFRLRDVSATEITPVNIVVSGIAQRAGIFLQFSGENLDLGGPSGSDGASERFVMELAGVHGLQEISFASGTTIESVSEAINLFAAQTGVNARVSGTGVRIDSDEYGSDQFTSVSVVDAGNINAARADAGVYRLDPSDPATLSPDPEDRTVFSAALNTITDRGNDIDAYVNGVHATGRGRSLSAVTADFVVEMKLRATQAPTGSANANHRGTLQAFVLSPASSPAPFSPDEAGVTPESIARFRTELSRQSESLSAWRAATLRPEMQRVMEEIRAFAAAPSSAPRAGERLTPERTAALLGGVRPE